MVNENLQRKDGLLLLQKKRDLLRRWDRLAQQQLALRDWDDVLPLLQQKEDYLRELQQVDALWETWRTRFPETEEAMPSPTGLQALLERIQAAELEFVRRIAQERNTAIAEMKTLQQQLRYGNPTGGRSQPRRRKTIS